MRMRSWAKRITEAVGLHAESVPGTTILELCGDDRVLIENVDRVISFDLNKVIVSVSFGFLTLEGERLILDYIGEAKLLITGKIAAIAVEREDCKL